jgi:phosphate transport system substrate-binding protein
MMRFLLRIFAIITVLYGCSAQPASNGTVTAPGVYIQNSGSDTMVNLALAWAEAYQKDHPEVRISVTGGGSGTGLASLINGSIDIANASRAIKSEEIDSANKNGFEPIKFTVAHDAIAIIVNPENPIQQLTLEQVSAIYRGEINNWSEIGGSDRPIVRLSRETNSGTHVYFLETVIRLGSKTDKSIFSANTLLLPSSEVIISEVKENPNAIGYDSLGYITPEVKVIAVSQNGVDFVLPSVETVNNGAYPISRDLYMYSHGEPQGEIKAYLDWILSPTAQEIVRNLGFVPLTLP